MNGATHFIKILLTSAAALPGRLAEKIKAMPRYRPVSTASLAVVATAAVIVLSPDSTGYTKPGDLKLNPVAPDGLHVVQLSPTGRLKSADQSEEITAVFSESIIALGTVKQSKKAAFRLQPAVAGRWRWYGSKVASFIPDKQLPAGESYRVIIDGTLKSQAGNTIRQNSDFPLEYRFSTPPLKVTYTNPSKDSLNAYDKAVTMNFNYPVDLASARSSIRVNAGGAGHPVNVNYGRRYNKEERLNQLVISPAQPWPRNSTLEVTIGGALKPLGASRAWKKSHSHRIRTYGPFKARLDMRGEFMQNFYPYLHFDNPVRRSDLADHVRVNGKALKNTTKYSTTYYYLSGYSFKAGQAGKITIKKGLKDIYGNDFTGPYELDFNTPVYRRTLSTRSGIIQIEKTGKKLMPVEVAALPSYTLESSALSLDRLVGYNNGGKFDSGTGSSETIKTGLDETMSGMRAIDLSKLFKSKGNWLALRYSADVQSYEGKPTKTSYSQFVVDSDIGIVVKEDFEKSYIWVHSLSTGHALPGIKITGYHFDDKMGSCTSAEDGWCRIQHLLKRVPGNSLYTAEGQADRAFVISRSHEVSSYLFNVPYSPSASHAQLVGQMLYDRKLYRPGDNVSVAAFVSARRNGILSSSDDVLGGIRATVENSKGEQIFEQTLQPSDEGRIIFELKLEGDAPLGHYNVRLTSVEIEEDKSHYSSTIYDSFQVEEFRPAEFSLEVSGLNGGTAGSTDTVKLEGRYLYGAAMNGAPIQIYAKREAVNPEVAGYEDYLFGDYDYGYSWNSSGYSTFSSTSTRLDSDGLFEWPLQYTGLPGKQTPGGLNRHYKVELTARVEDRDKKSVSKNKYTRVWAGQVVPGVRCTDCYHTTKRPFKFDLVSLSAAGMKRQPAELKAVVVKKEWKAVKSKTTDGSVQVKNTLIRTEVKSATVSTSSDGTGSFKFNAPSAGNYSITFSHGQSYTRIEFYAFGDEYVDWYNNDDNSIQLLADRPRYKKGDTASLIIKTPFKKADTIVTIEREKIYHRFVIPAHKNGQPVKVPIKEAYYPNVYVSVMQLLPRNKAIKPTRYDDRGIPDIKLGTIKLEVGSDRKKIPLSITSNRRKYGPRDQVTVNIITVPNAEVVLSVADRAVLDLIAYHWSDPVKKFYPPVPLGVRMLENRGAILEQLTYANKGKAPGGKGADEMEAAGFGHDSADGQRTKFNFTAAWKPKLKADEDGKISLKFTLPDNLTTFKMQALAARKGRYGRADHEIQVAKPVLVRPSLPAFVRPGDRLKLSALVDNQTPAAAEMRVTLRIRSDRGLYKRSRLVTIPANNGREVTFDFKAGKGFTPGEVLQGVIRASTTTKGKKLGDGITFELPVREPLIFEHFTIAGRLDKSRSKSVEKISLPDPDSLASNRGGVNLTLSPTVLSGLEPGFRFFRSNPYYCLEQRSSAYLLSITSGSLARKMAISDPDGYDLARTRELFIDQLASFQNDDGGFRLWKDSSSSSRPYLTAWVLHVLQIKNEAGAPGKLDASIQDRGYAWLKKWMKGNTGSTSLYQAESLAFVNWVLSNRGMANQAVRNWLLKNRDRFSLRTRLHLALEKIKTDDLDEISDDPLLGLTHSELKNAMQFKTRGITLRDDRPGSAASWYSQGSLQAAAIRFYLALSGEDYPLLHKLSAAVLQSQASWNSSHNAGSLSDALYAFHRRYEDDNGARALIRLGKKKLDYSLPGLSNLKQASFSLPALRKMGNPLDFILQRKEGTALYYTATMSYTPRDVFKGADEGIEIRRQLYDLADAKNPLPLTDGGYRLKRGRVYMVRLQTTTTKPLYDVLIEDQIASNMSIVNERFQTENAELKRILSRFGNHYLRSEYRRDRYVVTAESQQPGFHEYAYLVRPLVAGKSVYPPARSFAMYEPEVFGYTPPLVIRVE